MTAQEIIDEIKPLGKECYKRTMMALPLAAEHIERARQRNTVGKKCMSAKC